MKIRHRLNISAAVSILLIAIFFSLLLHFSYRMNRELEKAEVANQLVKETTDLILITNNYLWYHYDRHEEQWQCKYKNIETIITKNKHQIPLLPVQQNLKELNQYFYKLRNEHLIKQTLMERQAAAEEIQKISFLEDMLSGQMQLRAEQILAMVFAIYDETQKTIHSIQTQRNYTVLVYLLFLLLIVVMNSWMTIKRISRPLTTLLNGVNRIEKGDLKARVDFADKDEQQQADEVEELAVAFNTMAERLDNTFQSLRIELSEREKAESALRKAHADLGRRVEERTAELNAAKQGAETANQAKNIFLENMSHEIRTPLNAILGFSEILYEKETDDHKRSLLKSILFSGKMLLKLINDILELSKVKAGDLTVEPVACSVRDVIEEVCLQFKQQIVYKGLEYLVEVDEYMPPALLIDARLLKQILINLLSNAIKFTEQGTVMIVAKFNHATNSTDDRINLEIDVKDTGMGIPEKQISTVFEAFKQRLDPKQSHYGGIGLGLTSSNHLAQIMNGQIVVDSEENLGSTFKLILNDVPVTSLPDRDQEIDKGAENSQERGISLELLQQQSGLLTMVKALDITPAGLFQEMAIDRIEQYAGQIEELAQEQHCQVLKNWAEALQKAVLLFELDNVKQLLNDLQQVLDRK